jgi:hypothetical protein
VAKIIYRNEVYQEISLKMFLESEVQDAFASRAHLVFPGYNYSRFDAIIRYENDSARPDFVLIEQGYRAWYIGEIEMVRHDLFGHVLRQIRVFVSGEYGVEHLKQIIDRRPDLDQTRLQLLVETVQPTVLVLSDKMEESWKTAIHSEGAKMAVFEIFRREQSADLLFRVNGYEPEIPGVFLSHCEFDRSLPRLLRVLIPAGVPAVHGQKLVIEYEGILSEWVYVVADDKAWLNPIGYPDLPRDIRYRLNLVPNGKLKLEAK